MTDYNIFLKISGLDPLIFDCNNNVQDLGGSVNININLDTGEVFESKHNRQQNFLEKICNIIHIKYCLSILYFIFVTGIVLWPFITLVNISISNDDDILFVANIYSLLTVCQYVFGIIYFRKSHFKQILDTNSDYSQKFIDKLFLWALIISIIIALVSVILLVDDHYVSATSYLYSDSSSTGKICLVILTFFEKFYSYNIFCINTIIFAVVIIIQSNNINNFVVRFNRMINTTEGYNISSILNDYTDFAEKYNATVDEFNFIFSTLIIIGSVEIYGTLKYFDTSYIDLIQYMNGICYMIIQFVYVYSVHKIKDAIKKTKGTLNNTSFRATFLYDYKFQNIDLDNEQNSNSMITRIKSLDVPKQDKNIERLILRTMSYAQESANTNYWIMMTDKLNEPLESYHLLIFVLDDDAIMEKAIAILGGVATLALSNI